LTATMEKWNAVMGSLAHVRKVLRFFKSIAVLRGAMTLLRQHSHSFYKDGVVLVDLMSRLFLAAYFALDHVSYASKFKLIHLAPAQETQLGYLTEGSWLCEIVCSLLLALLKLRRLSGQQTSNVAQHTMAVNAQLRSVAKNALDLPIAMHFLNLTGKCPHGHFGTLGVISSLISLWEIWPVVFSAKSSPMAVKSKQQ